ncbi:MAG: FkbM family methyltransferase [Leptolyngbyaceae cyanobacterium SL_5_9]|nr:FkbM family methyltransferase [Leptolyngbyaceae cyanobacterium SL_5_9]
MQKNVEELIWNADFVVCNENDNFGCLCSNSFFAAETTHKILEKAVNELLETDIGTINSSSPAAVTGPYFFRRIINNYRVKILPTETLYPYMHFKRDYYRFAPDKIYAIHHWHNSWLPLDSLKWLAERQLLNGDYLSCLETCHKVSCRFGSDTQISLISSKSTQAIRQRKTILKLLRKPLFEPMLIYFQDLAISRILLKEESQANSRKSSLQSLLGRAMKKINRKIINSNFFKVHSNHLLDYAFANLSANKVIFFGTLDEGSSSILNLYIEEYQNVIVTIFNSVEDELHITQSDILQVDVDGYDEVLLKELLKYSSPKIILLQLFEKFSKEREKILSFLRSEGYFIFMSSGSQTLTACQRQTFYDFCLHMSTHYSMFPEL